MHRIDFVSTIPRHRLNWLHSYQVTTILIFISQFTKEFSVKKKHTLNVSNEIISYATNRLTCVLRLRLCAGIFFNLILWAFLIKKSMFLPRWLTKLCLCKLKHKQIRSTNSRHKYKHYYLKLIVYMNRKRATFRHFERFRFFSYVRYSANMIELSQTNDLFNAVSI